MTTDMKDWKPVSSVQEADPDDLVLVFLDDVLQGMVVEADVGDVSKGETTGYVIKKTWDGCLVTFKGKVRITLNGIEAVRVELGNPYNLKEPTHDKVK